MRRRVECADQTFQYGKPCGVEYDKSDMDGLVSGVGSVWISTYPWTAELRNYAGVVENESAMRGSKT